MISRIILLAFFSVFIHFSLFTQTYPEIDSDFLISGSDGSGGNTSVVQFPSVAYNTQEDEYLVVWAGTYSGVNGLDSDEPEIWGQLVNASTGNLIGNNFRISDLGPTNNETYGADAPKVIYNSQHNEYLVVFYGDNDTPPIVNGESEIYGQRLDADGNEIGENDFRISTMGDESEPERTVRKKFDGYFPDVAYNATNDEYMVVWYGDNIESDLEIWGQRLRGIDGAEIGGDFQISFVNPTDPFHISDDPIITWNSDLNQYLVVWHGGNFNTKSYQMYGQRIDSTGFPIANPVQISNSNGGLAREGYATYNTRRKEYLVIWGDGAVGSEFLINGQLLDTLGAKVGAELSISDNGEEEIRYLDSQLAEAKYDSLGKEYVVIWSGNVGTSASVDYQVHYVALNDSTGQRINPSGYRLSDGGGNVENNPSPALGFKASSREYLAVWSMNNPIEIAGQRFATGNNLCSDGIQNNGETGIDCGGSCPTACPTCDDGIQNGDETGVDCGGSCLMACPTCEDGIQNGDETGVDCGGSCPNACPTCEDGIQNGDETGVDCGGSCPMACPTCDDGIQNGDETGIDCGGSCPMACPTCDDGIQNGDETGIDCGGSCPNACPTCEDGIQNGDETGVDCGGSCPNACPTCEDGIQNGDETGVDCGGSCPTACPTCEDGIQNGDETGIDCGGSCPNACPTCEDGIQNGDETGVDCGGSCPIACPTCEDGIQNGDETGVDCGGSCPNACPTCEDGIQNGDETGVDCGGSCPNACPTCEDGIQNGDETGVDCGGSCPTACPTCDDGIQNGDETGVDCGGSCPNACCIVGELCDDGDTNTINDTLNINCICVGDTVAILNIRVFLEGAYRDTLMQDSLRAKEKIPIQSPYADAIMISDSAAISAMKGDSSIVDWAEVELRIDSDGIGVVRRSALVRRDGKVVDENGNAPIRFPNTVKGNYYVIIRHKNHIPMMTQEKVSLE